VIASLLRGASILALFSLVAAMGSFVCDNAGVTVDGRGNIVVRGENGFVSPNSSVLRNITQWPQPPHREQNFALSQGYALTRNGAMYVLANTAYHPNLVYRIDLSTGRFAPIGHDDTAKTNAFARSNETFIAATSRYAYSVDQKDPIISRADLSSAHLTLRTFIAGSKTQLRSPIGVAAEEDGRLCAIDSETRFVLCYAPNQRGNISLARLIDLKKLLGYAQVWDLVFDRLGHIIVSGTSDPNGVSAFSVAVIDIAAAMPRVLRVIAGPNTQLYGPVLAVDDRGDIFALQTQSPDGFAARALLEFGTDQHGDVAPRFVRKPAASVANPLRLAVDQRTGDVAILGSDGVALFQGAARRPPSSWPAEVRLPYRGWSIAFGGQSSLIVADQFGALETYGAGGTAPALGTARGATLNLHDPEFIATDQKGNVYVASTDGVITRLPTQSEASRSLHAWSFKTVFGRNMNAFAPDAAGYFYLASASKEAIVAVGPEGRQSVIAGPATGLDDPLGLAVNVRGALFVANARGKNLLVFARGFAGNAAPMARIEGPATLLIAPQALAIDAAGRLYVFDGPQTASTGGGAHYVRVYGTNARGNVAPLRSYEVKTTCWLNAP